MTQTSPTNPSPSSLDARYQSAHQLFNTGRYEEAIDAIRPLLGASTEAVKAWVLEGRIRAAMGEFQAAARAFAHAVSIAPTEPYALLEQAHFCHFLGEHAEALDLIAQTLQHTSHRNDICDAHLLKAEVLFALVQSQMSEGIMEQAEQQAELSDAILPSNPTVEHCLQQGLESLTQVLSLNPKLPDAWDLQASYFTTMRRFKEAADAWKQALRLEPNQRTYLHELGVTLETLKDFQGAKQAYQQLATLEANSYKEETLFPFEAFVELVQEVWNALEREMLPALHIPLPFDIRVEIFPHPSLLSQTLRAEPFDPWIPLSLDAQQGEAFASTIGITLYQRNIERDAGTEDPHELYLFLFQLLEDCLLRLDGLMNEDSLRIA